MNMEKQRRDYVTRFSEAWPRMMDAWNAEGPDAFFMIRHASYLFRVGGARWGVDLTLMTDEMMDFTENRARIDLEKLEFALVSHFHSDHFNARFARQMGRAPKKWLVPDFIPEGALSCLRETGAEIILLKPGDEMTIGAARVRALPGHHFDGGGSNGVPSLAYEVCAGGRTLAFPGDCRDFRPCVAAEPQRPDELFCHVWLGRGLALLPIEQTQMQEFCAYMAKYQSRRVFLTHLYNFIREETDYWTQRHALAVKERLEAALPGAKVEIPPIGEEVRL